MSPFAFADLLLRDAAALVIVKATVVLAFASAAAVAARGFSAARRHMLWLVALSSCVWLVLSSSVVPAIMIHTPLLAQNVVARAARATVAAFPRSRNATVANTSRVWERFPAIEAVRRSSVRSIPLPSRPLVALWVIGCVALLVRHAIGFVGATRLARRASIANDDETTRELARVTADVGVRREVRLAYSTEVRTPITFDVATPYVLLPTEARSWSIERRRAVLVHETAHIARRDWLSQTIGQLACELFWFHPLAWRAFAHLRAEAERAADDCVLTAGITAPEYATHLLELAQRTSNARPNIVAMGIVSTNDLERRFAAMFDIERSRTTVTSRTRAVTTSVALAIVCPLASLRVAAPARPMKAPLSRAPMQRAAQTPEVHAAVVVRPARETPRKSIAIVEHAAPRRVVHPDLSGKWKSDTVAVPTRYQDFFVTDSSIIRQSADSIAFESHSHVQDIPTHNRFHNITFDGAESSGVVFDGWQNHATNVIASAVWMGDTLILTTRITEHGHDQQTIERMTRGADGNTLLITNTSFVDGRVRWDGPFTGVLRRMAP